MTPQVLLTLSPSGALVAELPGPNGARRRIELRDDAEAAVGTLRRILAWQLAETRSAEIGEDGAPTERQVYHWEHHRSKHSGDSKCPFCRAEGRFASRAWRELARRAIATLGAGANEVQINRLRPKAAKAHASYRRGIERVLAIDPADPDGLPISVLRTDARRRRLTVLPEVQRTDLSEEELGL